MTDPREQAALRDQCTVFLTGHGPVRPADLLASIPADTVPDRYGDGGVVAELEAEIAGLLGKPAAVYLPSGTMAQQRCCACTPTGAAPQVSMMHLLLTATQEGFAAAARRLAAEQGVWAWPQAMVTPDPGVQRVELSVGDATRAVPPGQVRDIVTALTAS